MIIRRFLPKFSATTFTLGIGIEYFDGKEYFWNNRFKNYLLFGSETLKNSNKNIAYESQYKQPYLEFVRNDIDYSNQIISDIIEILEAYEIESVNKKNSMIIEKKNKIKKFNFIDKLDKELETSKFYIINNAYHNFKIFASRIISHLF